MLVKVTIVSVKKFEESISLLVKLTFLRQRLCRAKQEKAKKRRIQLLNLRTKEATKRCEWSKKHGGDTYGETDDTDSKGPEKSVTQIKKCKCGSTTHSRTTHRDCPLNMKSSNILSIDISEDLDFDGECIVYTAKDEDSDDELTSSDSNLEEDYLEDNDDEPECTCGAEGRAHKSDCPLNPRFLYQAKPAASTPVRPPSSTPFKDRKRSSLIPVSLSSI